MASDFDFITDADKPALLALSTPELRDTARTALEQLGYKVHQAENHGEFLHRFNQVPYRLVLLEDCFSGATLEANESLQVLQRMPMSQRRHAVIILFGFSLATFNPLQAFQHSVHAVINPSELFLLMQLIQKAVADNDLFLHTFRRLQQQHG